MDNVRRIMGTENKRSNHDGSFDSPIPGKAHSTSTSVVTRASVVTEPTVSPSEVQEYQRCIDQCVGTDEDEAGPAQEDIDIYVKTVSLAYVDREIYGDDELDNAGEMYLRRGINDLSPEEAWIHSTSGPFNYEKWVRSAPSR